MLRSGGEGEGVPVVRVLATIALFIVLSGCAAPSHGLAFIAEVRPLGELGPYRLSFDDRDPDRIHVVLHFEVGADGVGPPPITIGLVTREGVRHEPLRLFEESEFSVVAIVWQALEFGRPCRPEDLVAVEASVGSDRRRFDLTR
jgi:hypothetical protein